PSAHLISFLNYICLVLHHTLPSSPTRRSSDLEKIQFIYNSQVTAIHGDQKVPGLTLTDTITGQQRPLDATGVFIAIGHVPRTELVQDALDLDDEGYIHVQGRTTLTNVPGV